MADGNDPEVQAVEKIYVAANPTMWAEIISKSVNHPEPWQPGVRRAMTEIEKCEKCGLPVCTMREVDGSMNVCDIIQIGVMVTREELANPRGRTVNDFRVQTMKHECPPPVIAKILRDEHPTDDELDDLIGRPRQ